jgi:hypothetical protein
MRALRQDEQAEVARLLQAREYEIAHSLVTGSSFVIQIAPVTPAS